MKPSPDRICPKCGNECSDKTKPHKAHWSRKTIRTVECKVCEREQTYDGQLYDHDCPGLTAS